MSDHSRVDDFLKQQVSLKPQPTEYKQARLFMAENTMNDIQLVDLGLPSGTLWADRNVGAETPEGYGDYFRFGETTPFTENSPSYKYENIKKNIAGTDKDAATTILGAQFRMPTIVQIKELLDYCSRQIGRAHV